MIRTRTDPSSLTAPQQARGFAIVEGPTNANDRFSQGTKSPNRMQPVTSPHLMRASEGIAAHPHLLGPVRRTYSTLAPHRSSYPGSMGHTIFALSHCSPWGRQQCPVRQTTNSIVSMRWLPLGVAPSGPNSSTVPWTVSLRSGNREWNAAFPRGSQLAALVLSRCRALLKSTWPQWNMGPTCAPSWLSRAKKRNPSRGFPSADARDGDKLTRPTLDQDSRMEHCAGLADHCPSRFTRDKRHGQGRHG